MGAQVEPARSWKGRVNPRNAAPGASTVMCVVAGALADPALRVP